MTHQPNERLREAILCANEMERNGELVDGQGWFSVVIQDSGMDMEAICSEVYAHPELYGFRFDYAYGEAVRLANNMHEHNRARREQCGT